MYSPLIESLKTTDAFLAECVIMPSSAHITSKARYTNIQSF